jgi:hypothetical protein
MSNLTSVPKYRHFRLYGQVIILAKLVQVQNRLAHIRFKETSMNSSAANSSKTTKSVSPVCST